MTLHRAEREADKFFRTTPADIDPDLELEDRLAYIEEGLNERQLKALKS